MTKPAMTADRFRAIVRRAGLTRFEAAERLGVSAVTVYRWMTGRTPIAAGRAKLIELVLGGPAAAG